MFLPTLPSVHEGPPPISLVLRDLVAVVLFLVMSMFMKEALIGSASWFELETTEVLPLLVLAVLTVRVLIMPIAQSIGPSIDELFQKVMGGILPPRTPLTTSLRRGISS